MSAIVNIYNNPLDNKRKVFEVKTPTKVKDLLNGLNKEYCLIYVNGNEVDSSYILKPGDICTIRQFAAGKTTAAFFLDPTGFFVTDYIVHGFSWKGSWTAQGLNKLRKWLFGDIDTPDTDTTTEGNRTPTIGGCKNASALDKPVPIILGKTLMTPYVYGKPYITIDTSSDAGHPYFHCLYVLGYKNLQVRDISLGIYKLAKNDGSTGVSQSDWVTPLATDIESGRPALLAGSQAHFPPATFKTQLEIQQGASEISIYPQKVVQEEYGANLQGVETLGDIHAFSAEYPHKVEVQVTFPNGLICYKKKDGKEQSCDETIYIAMSKDGGTTWEPFAHFNRSNSTGNSNGYAWSKFTRTTTDEMNFVASRTFSYNEVKNLTNNVLEFKIYASASYSGVHEQVDCYLRYVRTWCYDPDKSKVANTIVIQRPMEETRRNRTARIALVMRAGEDVQGTVDQLNCICTSKARTWNGTQWSTALSPTNNPAALMLMAMQGVCRGNRPYPDSRIDFEALGAFYEYCADTSYVGDGLPRFSCNGALLNKTKTKDLLKQIAACGRGSLSVSGNKYTVVIDSPRNVVSAIFNEQSFLSVNNRKEFAALPDGFECRFINALKNYQEDSLVVWFNTTKAEADRIIEPVEYPFITDARRVVKQAWYDYAIRKLRPEVWERKQGIDGNLVEPGDLVEIQDQSISVGIGEGAEVKSLVTDGNYITGIVTDGRFTVADIANEYGVKIVSADGISEPTVIHKKLIFADTGAFSTLTFAEPISLDATIKPYIGDIVSFGLYQMETVQCLCLGKKDNGDGTFEIAYVPYQEGVYTADSGKVPEYDSKLTTPTAMGLEVSKDYATPADVQAVIDELINGDTDILPNDCVSLGAVAEENGITFTPGYASTTLRDDVTFKYQIKRGNSAEWVDISVRNRFYPFNRTIDGYPEYDTLSNWKVRVKAVNIYGNESENWVESLVDTYSYGTWIVGTPVLTLRTNKRSLHVHMEQPAQQRPLYGIIRYRMQISRYDDVDPDTMERLWYKPDLSVTADPYGAETNYKVDTDPAPVPDYVLATADYSQTVPLEGQSRTPASPSDTVYYFRIVPVNETTGVVGNPIETGQMTARATGARDVVLARLGDGSQHPDALTAKNIYAENLTAIAGTFSQVQGDAETSDSFWRGMDTDNPEFRVGNDHNLEEQDSEEAEYIHYKDGSLAMRLKNFIVTVRETTIKGTLTLYNAAKDFRNLVSSSGMTFQKKVTDWLNPVDVAQISADEKSNLVITNNPSALSVEQIAPPSSTIKIHHLDSSLNDTDGNNTESLIAASGGCGATAEPVLARLKAYFDGKLTKGGVVAKGTPAYNAAAYSQSGLTVLGVCNGTVAGYTVNGNIYTFKTVNIKTGDVLTSFDWTLPASDSVVTNTFHKAEAFWTGTAFIFGISRYSASTIIGSRYYFQFYAEDGTRIFGGGTGMQMGYAYGTCFGVSYSGLSIEVQSFNLTTKAMNNYTFTITGNPYATQIEAMLVSGWMIMLKCNNTNLSTHPYLYAVSYTCSGAMETNIYPGLTFVDSWTDYGAETGYLHATGNGVRYLFKNTDLMNPVQIDTAYYPIRNGADDNTLYLYKPGDNGIYTLVDGVYTKLGTAAASSLYLRRLDNDRLYCQGDNTVYFFPAYNQSLVDDKHYAFWFKGGRIRFGKVTIPCDANNWLYCRLTASGTTVSWIIVKNELINDELDVFASGSSNLANYGLEEDNEYLDFVLEGAVEEFTSDTADISTAVMKKMVEYKLPYGAPGTSENLPGTDKFTLLAKDPRKVISNVIGASQVIPAGGAVTLSPGANPGQRLIFTALGTTASPCTITYTGILGADVTDTIKTVTNLEYTWTGSAWFCSSAPPIDGPILEQKPDELPPAAMYGGQWQEHNYGGVFFRSKGGDSCGFHAAYKVSSWASGSSVTLAENAVDGNGTAISANNYILVAVYGAASYYRKITGVSGRVLTLESALPSGYANLTDVLIGEMESLPNITGDFAQGFGVRNSSGHGALKEVVTSTAAWIPQASSSITDTVRGWKFNASHSNPIYGRRTYVEPNTVVLVYWERLQ